MLSIDLKGKKAFIAGIGDDQGYGWAIAKALAEAGAEIIIGTWTPIVKIFTTSWNAGKFDESRRLSDGTLMQYLKVYSLDASFDRPEDVPEEIRNNKRYQDVTGYTISEVAAAVERKGLRQYYQMQYILHFKTNFTKAKQSGKKH